jgi:hypothetical protein
MLLALLVGTTGCGGAGNVTGTITYKGKPVASGSVLILDRDGLAHHGPLQQDGSFSISGVRRGEARLAVNSPNPRTLLAAVGEKVVGQRRTSAPSPSLEKWFSLPPKFGDPIQSGLKMTVHGGVNSLDIDLKND